MSSSIESKQFTSFGEDAAVDVALAQLAASTWNWVPATAVDSVRYEVLAVSRGQVFRDFAYRSRAGWIFAEASSGGTSFRDHVVAYRDASVAPADIQRALWNVGLATSLVLPLTNSTTTETPTLHSQKTLNDGFYLSQLYSDCLFCSRFDDEREAHQAMHEAAENGQGLRITLTGVLNGIEEILAEAIFS